MVSTEEKKAQDYWAGVRRRIKMNGMARMFARALRKKMGVTDYHSDSSDGEKEKEQKKKLKFIDKLADLNSRIASYKQFFEGKEPAYLRRRSLEVKLRSSNVIRGQGK